MITFPFRFERWPVEDEVGFDAYKATVTVAQPHEYNGAFTIGVVPNLGGPRDIAIVAKAMAHRLAVLMYELEWDCLTRYFLLEEYRLEVPIGEGRQALTTLLADGEQSILTAWPTYLRRHPPRFVGHMTDGGQVI